MGGGGNCPGSPVVKTPQLPVRGCGGVTGSIPGPGTKIPLAALGSQKIFFLNRLFLCLNNNNGAGKALSFFFLSLCFFTSCFTQSHLGLLSVSGTLPTAEAGYPMTITPPPCPITRWVRLTPQGCLLQVQASWNPTLRPHLPYTHPSPPHFRSYSTSHVLLQVFPTRRSHSVSRAISASPTSMGR